MQNWMGSLHGLVIGALADLVTSWAICANGEDYLDHSSVSLEVNFLKCVTSLRCFYGLVSPKFRLGYCKFRLGFKQGVQGGRRRRD